jgi:hypothetical protein
MQERTGLAPEPTCKVVGFLDGASMTWYIGTLKLRQGEGRYSLPPTNAYLLWYVGKCCLGRWYVLTRANPMASTYSPFTTLVKRELKADGGAKWYKNQYM